MNEPSEILTPKPSVVITEILGLAALGLAVSTLAGRMGRLWWVMDLFTHFTVYYAVASLGLMVLALLLRRKRIALFMLVVLVINAWVIGPTLWPHRQASDSKSPVLRLAQVNVLHKNRDRGKVVDFLRNCKADLIFAQEVDRWWEGVLREAETPYRIAVSQPEEGSFGIALLIRESLADDSAIALLDTRIFDFADQTPGAQRPAIEATLLLAGQRVRLLSVHPPPPVSSKNTALRDDVLRRAKAWSDQQTDPHLIIGDLSTTPWSYAFSILDGDGELISTQDGRGNQGSWPATLPVPWMIPIDHCLHSPELVCRGRRIGPDIGSDHLPLIVSLVPQRPFDSPVGVVGPP